jgi:hypothetical protein
MDTTKTLINSVRLALSAKDAAALVDVSRAQWWKLHGAGKIPLSRRLQARRTQEVLHAG